MAQNFPPSAPTNRKINPGSHSVVVSGVIFNPQQFKTPEKARLEVQISKQKNMSGKRTAISAALPNGDRASVTINGLDSGTVYYIRMYSRDTAGNLSNSYASEDFRTDGTPVATVATGSKKAHAPSPPTDIEVNGVSAADEQVTHSTGSVVVSAVVDDPDTPQKVRLVARWSQTSDFSTGFGAVESGLVASEGRATVTLTGLSQNTLYHVRLWARDAGGLLSNSYTTTTFWTNRSPVEPNVTAPPENAQSPRASALTLSWAHQDPDEEGAAPQRAYNVRYRTASTVLNPSGPWVSSVNATERQNHVLLANTLQANTNYEWQVQTSDPEGTWGPFSQPRSFFVTGTSAPPVPIFPSRGEAVDVTEETAFAWLFRDPDPGATQQRADLRYRTVGTQNWTTLTGTTTIPGALRVWVFDSETLYAGLNYEWQVRTYDLAASPASDWSESGTFWTIRTPGTGAPDSVIPDLTEPVETLGQGAARAYVYQRGGTILLGEITPLTTITWNRKRDDISDLTLTTNGFGEDCGELLWHTEPWMHEIVVYRDGLRVWEGPITLVKHTQDGVTIQAKDVMAYVYRRIMRQGYDDSYRFSDGQQQGLKSVVERAERLTMNALAPDDPNVLAYLTAFKFPDDARQSRVRADFASTAWEEIDDLAATAGLDYTVVGRRILYWDVHRPIGRLPEMRDKDFDSPPVVSKYGMQLATDFGVTNNNGVYGLASRPEGRAIYGLVEQLASAYGETSSDATEETLTVQGRIALESTLSSQAERNIQNRYPTPLIVRVPDNSTLSPDIPLTINQLVPGAWIPLRSRGPTWDLAQWQKLDEVTLTQTSAGETIQVTMSPAPNAGEDPDAESTATEDA